MQTVPPRRRPVPVTDTTQFRFAEDTVLRQESFGGVISDGSQSTLVDSTTFGICRALRATGAFSVLYAANRFQVAVDEARDVLSRLAGQQLIRLVAPVSETKGKEVSQ